MGQDKRKVPHWLSYRDRLLPKCPVPLSGVFAESLQQFTELDWMAFQKLPICKSMHALNMTLGKMGVVSMDEAVASYRSALEETWAVASFVKTGCRIIQPSRVLVEQLMETDVTFPLRDVRPPWPHVYIELPPGIDVILPNFSKPGEESRAAGFYVTWAEVGQETRRSYEALKTHGYVKTQAGLVAKNELPADMPYEEASDVKPEDLYGDWFGRFCITARDSLTKDQHDWTVHYFSMHWADQDEQPAEGAFVRFAENWNRVGGRLYGNMVPNVLRNKVFHLAANLFLYMSMPQNESDVVWQPDDRRERLRVKGEQLGSKQRRKLRNRVDDEMRTESWIVGQHVVLDRRIEKADTVPGTSADSGRASPKTHWRRGHWRGVWTGPMTGPRKLEPRWIKPVLIGGDGSVPAETTYTVR